MSTSLGTAYINIEADWDSFNRRTLPEVQRRLGGISTSQTKAATTTSRLSRATSGLGGSLARAAGAAAGAAAAYISISQAKEAVTATNELAKSTLTLQANLGVATKEASRWAVVARARGVDMRGLAQAFGILSKNVDAATHGGTEQLEMFQRLGLSMRDLKSANSDWSGFVAEFADGLGKMGSGSERTALMMKTLGRGWLQIAPMMREGSDALKEQLALADKYHVTFGQQALDDQEKLIAAQRESQMAWMGIQVAFTRAVTPAIIDANEKFQRLAKTLTDPKLTDSEKFQIVGNRIAHIANAAKKAFIQVLPEIVERAAKAGPQIAGALVQGFMQSDALGKLFIGGALLTKFGGTAAMTALGTKMGGRMGKAAAPAFALAFITLGLTDAKVRASIEEGGKRVGELFVNGLIDALNFGLRNIFEGTQFGPLGEGLKQLGIDFGDVAPQIDHVAFSKYQKVIDSGVTDSAKRGMDAIAGLKTEIKQLDKAMDAGLKPTLKSNAANIDNLSDNFNDLRPRMKDTRGDLGDLGASLDRTGEKAKKQGDVFKDVWGETSKRSGKLARNVTANNANMTNTVGEGLGVLRDNVLAATKEFGVKSRITYSIKKADKAVSTVTNLLGAQTGAIVPGTGSGDTVPLHIGGQLAAMVEPGELVSVANRKATSALMDVNSKIPRFRDGGVVPRLAKGGMAAMLALANKYERKSYPYLWGGGHAGFVNASSPVDCSGAVSDVLHAGGLLSGAPMVSGSLMSWGKPARGNEPLVVYANPVHTVMSLNGKVFGTSGSNPGGGAGWIEGGNGASLAPGAKRTMDVVGGMAAHLARIILQGPAGKQRRLGQADLDRAHKAAAAWLSKKSPMGAAGGGDWGPVGDAIVKGRATWFTGGQMASGRNTDTDPGIALNPDPGGPDPGSWNNPTTQRWLADAQQFLVSIGGKQTALPVLDMGPAGWTGNAIDVDRAGVSKLGFSTSSFPSGSIGTARIIKRRLGGLVPHLKGGSKKPLGGSISGGHTDPAWIRFRKAQRIAQHIAAVLGDKGKVARLDERIGIAETNAGLASSPGREETTAAELATQIGLNERLLETLTRARKGIREGMKLTHIPKGMAIDKQTEKRLRGIRGALGEQLVGLVGVTGGGGRIYDVRTHLDELRHTTSGGGVAAMDISALRSVIQARDLGVFANLPKFHQGGVVPGPANREVPIMARGGEVVSPVGRGITNTVYWEGLDMVIDTRIDGRLAKRDRQRYHAQRAGVA